MTSSRNLVHLGEQGEQLDLFSLVPVSPPEPEPEKPFELREYQMQVVREIYKLLRAGLTSILVYAPTGAGKTVVSAKVIADAVRKGRRVLFLCHRQKLISQTQQTLLRNYGIETGIIWADHKTDYSKPVQIAMIQSIQNRQLPPDTGLVIFDEAHSSIYHKICSEIMRHYSGGITALSQCFFIGLSASPWRLKNKEGYCQFFQAIVRAPDLNELVKMGYLSRPWLFGYGGLIDFSALETNSEGEYTEASMSLACDEKFNSKVVEKYLEICPERKAISFCASVQQASDLSRQFNEQGINTAVVVGDTPEFLRELIYKRFATGEIQIISSVGCLCEGFDEPSVEAAIIARPTRSKALLIQMCGRALRIFKRKEDAFLLDFGECFKRCCDIKKKLPIALCPSFKPEPPSMLKECPECHAMIYKFLRVCPECGYEFDGGSDDDEGEGDEPVFGELLTEQEKTAIRYIRSQMKRAFNAGRNPWRVKKLFLEKFGYAPFADWFVGSIFGMKNVEVNKQIYSEFLYRINPKATPYWVKGMLEMEFGKPWKKYKTKFGKNYKAPKLDNVTPRTWWEILGVSAKATWGEIRSRYLELAKQWHPDVCSEERAIEIMKLINHAFDSARVVHSR